MEEALKNDLVGEEKLFAHVFCRELNTSGNEPPTLEEKMCVDMRAHIRRSSECEIEWWHDSWMRSQLKLTNVKFDDFIEDCRGSCRRRRRMTRSGKRAMRSFLKAEGFLGVAFRMSGRCFWDHVQGRGYYTSRYCVDRRVHMRCEHDRDSSPRGFSQDMWFVDGRCDDDWCTPPLVEVPEELAGAIRAGLVISPFSEEGVLRWSGRKFVRSSVRLSRVK